MLGRAGRTTGQSGSDLARSGRKPLQLGMLWSRALPQQYTTRTPTCITTCSKASKTQWGTRKQAAAKAALMAPLRPAGDKHQRPGPCSRPSQGRDKAAFGQQGGPGAAGGAPAPQSARLSRHRTKQRLKRWAWPVGRIERAVGSWSGKWHRPPVCPWSSARVRLARLMKRATLSSGSLSAKHSGASKALPLLRGPRALVHGRRARAIQAAAIVACRLIDIIIAIVETS
jgi:hypothetical protein